MKTKKAQVTVQETAFVLLALVILGAIAFLFFVRMQYKGIQESAAETQAKAAVSILQVIAAMPELRCSQTYIQGAISEAFCLDEDKLLGFKKSSANYRQIWQGLSEVKIIKIYPSANKGECNATSQQCNTFTLYSSGNANQTYSTFVSLCKENSIGSYECGIAKISVSTA